MCRKNWVNKGWFVHTIDSEIRDNQLLRTITRIKHWHWHRCIRAAMLLNVTQCWIQSHHPAEKDLNWNACHAEIGIYKFSLLIFYDTRRSGEDWLGVGTWRVTAKKHKSQENAPMSDRGKIRQLGIGKSDLSKIARRKRILDMNFQDCLLSFPSTRLLNAFSAEWKLPRASVSMKKCFLYWMDSGDTKIEKLFSFYETKS